MPPVWPIPLTIGTIPAPEHIIGREREVASACELLTSRSSVLLTGDRRMGKTSLSRLIAIELARRSRRVVKVSAERTSLDDFQAALARELRSTVTGRALDELDRWELTLKAGPVEATRASRVRVLDELVATAVRGGDEPLVLIVDEVPVLARSLEQANPGDGADLLISLRRLRQEHSAQLSMLLLGSIGFHHVADGAPGELNDLTPQAVGGLDRDDAIRLARGLMLGAQVQTTDDAEVGGAIADQAECHPFYIQHLVKSLRDLVGGRPARPTDVPGLVAAAMEDPDDPWNLRHYRNRIPSYYGKELAPVVCAVLDVYAGEDGSLTTDESLRLLRANPVAQGVSRDDLVGILERLEQDHYLMRTGRSSRYRSELLRRAWLALRR